jgi:hypothetical protein
MNRNQGDFFMGPSQNGGPGSITWGYAYVAILAQACPEIYYLSGNSVTNQPTP